MKKKRDVMEKLRIVWKKSSKKFWFVFLVFFILSVFPLFTHYYTLLDNKNSVSLFPNYPNSHVSNKNSTSNPACDIKLDHDPTLTMVENKTKLVSKHPHTDPCTGRYIYVHELPSRFNEDILKNCSSLIKWFDMCESISNMGFGPLAQNIDQILQNKSWYITNQFALELIFHNRIKHYKCLTNDSKKALAIYVPFYAGLDVGRYLWGGFNTSVRDSNAKKIVKWLKKKPEWKYMWGRDHFFTIGRITWDFKREKNSGWGSKLMVLPEIKNATILIIESSPYSKNEYAVPYPTYFHPLCTNEVFEWQKRARKGERKYLFSFAGGPRPNMEDSIRSKIINQCLSSQKCGLLDCASSSNNCNEPVHMMKMFQSSVFCLQPTGDSYTRRSTFDSILAGCIPVFFHPASAYVQYIWHLPKDYTKYSVFIPESGIRNGRANIKEILSRIPEEKVVAMREEVVRIIPRVIFADPRGRFEGIEDAFDVAINGVLERVERIRREMEEGKSFGSDFDQENSMRKHEWGKFFTKSKEVDT